ncbi:hypothetical protein MF271_04940 [Deinococcus sp. KNUC1210]|uniref:hypothetical protein n=1 Tax=Deinococcus sp. KNUC1210 TaxID=2917691 RepID=UPI001EF0B574|nr:hypothetical protein [Deinococcus sp. KNUC1210]ULH15981.1 hypothetical protein MF271_04940 [Deinococcus sp. KNUC1210]
MKRLLSVVGLLLAFCFLPVVLAQTTIPPVSGVIVPDYIWTIASLAIGWLVKEISSPLTALLKRRFEFQSSVTQYIYILLSALFVVGFGLVSGAFGGGSAGWWAALGALLTAVIKGFGDYAKLQQAAASTMPTVNVTNVAPLVLHSIGTPGTEPLHTADGRVVGAVPALRPSTSKPQPVNGLEPLK